MTNCALTMYPLSRGYRLEFERTVGASPNYLSVAELRQLPVAAMIRRLRSLRFERLMLPMEDEGSRAVLPLLKLLASFTPSRSIEVFHPDLRSERVSRGDAAFGLVGTARASIAATFAMRACTRDLERLARAALVNPSAAAGSVLYVNANLRFGIKSGGSIGHIAGVVNGLRAQGRSVHLASVGGRTLIRDDIPLTVLQPPEVFGLPYERNYFRFHRIATTQLLRKFESTPPGLIYQRMSLCNYTGVVLSRQWHVPLVLEYNGSEVWVARNWGRPLKHEALASAVEATCLRHAHVVVTVSDALKDDLIQRGVPEQRIVVYPNCVDPDVFDSDRFTAQSRGALRTAHGIGTDALVVTFIGTFGQWHGVDVLAEAIRRLVEESKEWLQHRRVQFMLIGDGLKMRTVRETLASVNAQPFVTLTGLVPQSEAPRYLAASDILLSPHVPNADGSPFFGSPTKLFEYMAAGKAIVASDLDQIGKVLRPALSADAIPTTTPAAEPDALAVLTRPGDVDQLKAAIRFLAEAPAWRSVLGANARREVIARYTWAHHVKAITDRIPGAPTS